jgi:site-specific recombinase XerD
LDITAIDIKPTLVLTKGKWYVCVTIPTEYRSALRGQKQKKLSTGTSDRSIAEKLFISKANKLIAEIRAAIDVRHPLVQAAQKVIDNTSEITHGYAAEQILDPETFYETVIDIRGRAAYAERIDHLISDPEDGILIGKQQDAVEKAMIEFEDQLALFKPNNSMVPSAADGNWLLSAVLDNWMAEVSFNRQKTKHTYKSHVERFIRYHGDMGIHQISKANARDYVNYLSEEGKAHSTIETAVASLRGLLNFAEEEGLIDDNVFRGLRLRGKGKPSQRRATFSIKQLRKLFSLKMTARDKLCLQILAATGMRLDEVALLRFEDIKIDDDTGIRYFDLTDEAKLLKNDQASRRKIPLPNDLTIPVGEVGRLFNYPLDRDGKAENAASKSLLRVVKLVRGFPEENLVVHSLRHTYKDMLRDAGVAKDMQDFLLGHAASSVGDSYGQGYSLQSKKNAIDKLDLSFLHG